jgi:hypothetical protein
MPAEHRIAIGGLAFLVIGGLLLVASVRRGRELCRRLAERLPDEYAELGSPLPGYFDSTRRDAYFRLVMQRGYATLSDPYLVAEFARLRKSESGQLVYLMVGFACLGIAFVWMKWFHSM